MAILPGEPLLVVYARQVATHAYIPASGPTVRRGPILPGFFS